MNLNESIVEGAALEWFLLRQGYGGQVGELGMRGINLHFRGRVQACFIRS